MYFPTYSVSPFSAFLHVTILAVSDRYFVDSLLFYHLCVHMCMYFQAILPWSWRSRAISPILQPSEK